MSFKRTSAVVAIVLASVLATAVPALARGKAVERPFRGTWTGQPVDPIGVECPPGTFPGRTVATGHANHLGRFDLVVTGCLDPVQQITTGVASYTAANGDELHLAFIGQVTVNEDGSFTTAATGTDATGTGRFASAVAKGTDTITLLPDGSATGGLDGTITFNASDRSN